MKGKTLVTGASGLVGQRVMKKLTEAGRDPVGIDLARKPGHLPVEIVDLGDIHRLHAVTLAHGITEIVHCGAVSGPMVMVDNPHAIVVANVLGTTNILELARIHKMRRVVFCSSTSAYGPTPKPTSESGMWKEDAPLNPANVYGATKVACEALINGYRKQHGVDGVSIRLSWVYGPGRTTDCIIRDMIEDAFAGRQTRIAYGEGFPRQFIHRDDAAAALIAALDAPECPLPAYTATGGEFIPLGRVAALVKAELPDADIVLEPNDDPQDEWQYRFDISAIEADLGYRPTHPFADGVKEYVAYLRPQ
ncbi:NAD-dependent epimerase/dehydratase family protein [Acuticoccus kandeliae]|uniref:NAD-dependent epimerase/dehydratase family protein n=1 Tax=Acuticoccus kandeliae TaxID=2073160 RepID=UPI000D3E0F96|nr:NAD(P)-dependent oxidoreductase [Acuticoccus kandeliae]